MLVADVDWFHYVPTDVFIIYLHSHFYFRQQPEQKATY